MTVKSETHETTFNHKERPKREMCHTWDLVERGNQEEVWVRRCDGEVQSLTEFTSELGAHELDECEALGHWPCVVCIELSARKT